MRQKMKPDMYGTDKYGMIIGNTSSTTSVTMKPSDFLVVDTLPPAMHPTVAEKLAAEKKAKEVALAELKAKMAEEKAKAAKQAEEAAKYITLQPELGKIANLCFVFMKYENNVKAFKENYKNKAPEVRNLAFLGYRLEFQHAVQHAKQALTLIADAENALKQGIGTDACAETLAKYKEQVILFLTEQKVTVPRLKANPIDTSKFPRCPGGCRKTYAQVRNSPENRRVRGSRALICHNCVHDGLNGRKEYTVCNTCGVADKVSNLHACLHDNNHEYCKDCMEQHRARVTKCNDEDTIAPWIARGLKPKFFKEDNDKDSPARWGFQSTNINPVQVAADYYILLVIRDKLYEHREMRLHGFNEEARERLAEIVDQYDPVFRAYVDMVVGGELRYHGATHAGGLRKQRHQSWNAWKRIREQQGPQALLDAAFLFRRIKPGSSVGGEKWAVIAETLHARVTNQITPELWLDRVFALQHNGGIVLNKVSWLDDPHRLTHYIGPAHASNPPLIDSLAWFASEPIRHLLYDYLCALRKERYGWKCEPLPDTLWVPPKDRIHIDHINTAVKRKHSLRRVLRGKVML